MDLTTCAVFARRLVPAAIEARLAEALGEARCKRQLCAAGHILRV